MRTSKLKGSERTKIKTSLHILKAKLPRFAQHSIIEHVVNAKCCLTTWQKVIKGHLKLIDQNLRDALNTKIINLWQNQSSKTYKNIPE
jgi:hypothetical protein